MLLLKRRLRFDNWNHLYFRIFSVDLERPLFGPCSDSIQKSVIMWGYCFLLGKMLSGNSKSIHFGHTKRTRMLIFSLLL